MALGFVGAGHIAAAMVEGLRAAASPEPIVLSPRNARVAAELAARFPKVRVAASNQEVVDASDLVFLAVRPPVAPEVVGALRFRPDHVVVSLIALRPEAEMRALVGSVAALVRAVPLPSSARRLGPIAYFPEVPRVREILARLGTPVLARNEAEFHRLWSLTGLIAPHYRVMDTLAAWEEDGGVARETAEAFIRALFHAMAAMAETGPLDALARQAQTPGGINEQALRTLEGADAFAPWRAALDAVYARMTKGGGG